MKGFYEHNWETGKAVRWGIKRADGQPLAAASIWEQIVDKETGEIITSFSMLTINADGHEVMKHFHRPRDEKRSIVVLKNSDYMGWLHADHDEARKLLSLTPSGVLESAPRPKVSMAI